MFASLALATLLATQTPHPDAVVHSSVALSLEERDLVRTQAEEEGLSVSDWIRKRIGLEARGKRPRTPHGPRKQEGN